MITGGAVGTSAGAHGDRDRRGRAWCVAPRPRVARRGAPGQALTPDKASDAGLGVGWAPVNLLQKREKSVDDGAGLRGAGRRGAAAVQRGASSPRASGALRPSRALRASPLRGAAPSAARVAWVPPPPAEAGRRGATPGTPRSTEASGVWLPTRGSLGPGATPRGRHEPEDAEADAGTGDDGHRGHSTGARRHRGRTRRRLHRDARRLRRNAGRRILVEDGLVRGVRRGVDRRGGSADAGGHHAGPALDLLQEVCPGNQPVAELRLHPGRELARREGGTVSSSASAISSAVENRCAGSARKPAMTMASSAGGTSGASGSRGATAPASTIRMICDVVLGLEEALRPVSASQRTTDAAKTSVRRSIGSPLELLGRHVRELALELPVARRVRLARAPWRRRSRGRAATPSAPTRMFCGRDVAVDDAERLAVLVRRLVRGVQPVQHAAMMRDAMRERACGSPPREHGPQEPRERLALHVLHDEEELAVVGDDVERRHDVRGGGCARRAAPRRGTSRRTRGPRANCGCSRLMATVREKPARPEEAPEVDRRHPARRDASSDRVAADDERRRARGHGRSAMVRRGPACSEVRKAPASGVRPQPGCVGACVGVP